MGSDCVPQGCIQLGLEVFKGWRLNEFSGQSVLMLDCWEFVHGEEMFINVQTGTLFKFQFVPVIFCSSAMDHLDLSLCQIRISVSKWTMCRSSLIILNLLLIR